mmetsp:Transcript_38411/g.68723  ORF Transcript_38411/g.68723 Transcript_38411/m.68723 type:complete len:89 (-) Transcript_38411:32-298(-)
MFTLRSYFAAIPCETSVARLAAQAENEVMTDFCRGLFNAIVESVVPAPEPSPRRLPGRPDGSFDVPMFVGSVVCTLVEKAMSQCPVPC